MEGTTPQHSPHDEKNAGRKGYVTTQIPRWAYILCVGLSIVAMTREVIEVIERAEIASNTLFPGQDPAKVKQEIMEEIETYRDILWKTPNDYEALINTGNLYYETDQYLLAIEHYQKALAIYPSDDKIRATVAICYNNTGKPNLAIEELKKAIEINPKDDRPRYILGNILQEMGDMEGAVKAWEGILENVPDSAWHEILIPQIEEMRSKISNKQSFRK